MKPLKGRIDDLENRIAGNKQVIFWQDLEDDQFCFVNPANGQAIGVYHKGKPAERMTWADAYDQYSDAEYTIIRVIYVDDWRAQP